MASEFENGSVVQLKSGGPFMTVENYVPTRDTHLCTWFHDNKLERAEINAAALQKVDPSIW